MGKDRALSHDALVTCAFLMTRCMAAGKASVTPMTGTVIRLEKGWLANLPSAASAVLT